MRGVAFAARSGLSQARARPVWRGACPILLRCALALGLVCTFVAGSTAFERTGLEREIRGTQEVAADVANAVRRVQLENLKLLITLRKKVRELTAEDVTVTTLRLSRLDADTALLHVTTLDTRIAQREAELRLLEEDINGRAAELQGAPATAPETRNAQAELRQLRTLHAANVDLMEGFRKLRSAEAEGLALAGERLALLRSRAELGTIHEHGGFDQDPGRSRSARRSPGLTATWCGSTTRPEPSGKGRCPIQRSGAFCSSRLTMRLSAAPFVSAISS